MSMTPTEIRKTRELFDFLIDECGFHHVASVNCVCYETDDLYVEIWLSTKENDFLIGLKKDTAVIRPGMSHLFSFQTLIRHFHRGAFPLLEDFPRADGADEGEHYLRYVHHWVKRYLLGLLKGDLTVLDKLVGK